MDSDDIAATFDLRWQALALSETVHAPGMTMRPSLAAAATLVGREPFVTLPASLPHISLQYAGSAVPSTKLPARSADLEIVATLGEGGMGRVHLARQRSLGRDVAVKTLKPDTPERARSALLAEAAITGALEHPGIIPVHALGLDDAGRPVLVMKRVEGTEWRQLIHDPAHAAWGDVPESHDRLAAQLEIAMQVCNAVHFAHSRGIVHRDIKPENVMIGRYGEVYLVDWGIATRIDGQQTKELVGSPGYMAPEMVIGDAVDQRTDVYLLGATLHEVLTKSLRHDGRELQAVLLAAFRSEPHAYDASVPEELAALCNRATARDPASRPQTALEMREKIASFLRHKSSIALVASASERLAELRRLLEDDRPLADVPRAYRLMSECRFGLTQALEQWPDNRAARRALSLCIEAMAEVELRQNNASGARALLAELESPPPGLVARLTELESRIAGQRERDERLRRIEHDLDQSVGGPQRTRALLTLGLVALAISAVALSKGLERIEPKDTLLFAGTMLAIYVVALVLLRRQLLTNAFNRRGAALILFGVLGVVVNRSIGWQLDSPLDLIFTHDLLMMTVASAIGSAILASWVWPVAVGFAMGLVLVLAVPGTGPIAFSSATLAAIAIVIFAWRRAARRQELERK